MIKSLEGLIDHAQDWATRAEAFIIKNGWSITDENRPYVIQMTAIYLSHMDELNSKLVVKLDRKNCYVLHSQDEDWRYQSTDYNVVYQKFKWAIANNKRVGMFYWDSKGDCKRLHASDNYTLTRDY